MAASFDRLLAILPKGSSCFLYGSRVYQKQTAKSDFDFQVIVPKKLDLTQAYNARIADVHQHTVDEYQEALDNHLMYALECFFLPLEFRFKDEVKAHFKLDKAKLFSATLENYNNTMSRAAKRLENGEFALARKSTDHADRTVGFAIQIATTGRINSYNVQPKLVVDDLLKLLTDSCS